MKSILNSFARMGAWSYVAELISLIAIFGSIIYIITVYPDLPAEIPRHFDMSGNADAYAGKGVIWVLPILMFMLYVSLTGVLAINVKYLNFPFTLTEENKDKQVALAFSLLQWIKTLVIVFLAYTIVETAAIAMDPAADIFPTYSLWLFLIAIFGSIVLYLLRAKKYK